MGGVKDNFAPGGTQAPSFSPNAPTQWGNMGRAGIVNPVQASNSSNQTPAPMGDIVEVAKQIARQVTPKVQPQPVSQQIDPKKYVSMADFQKFQQEMYMQDPMYAGIMEADAMLQAGGAPGLFKGGGKG